MNLCNIYTLTCRQAALRDHAGVRAAHGRAGPAADVSRAVRGPPSGRALPSLPLPRVRAG